MPIVKAPLVIAKGEAGNDLYLYEGAEVPTLAEGELERLADYFEVQEESEESGRPAESGPGSAKDKWIEYAASNDVEIDESADKADIIAAVTAAGF